MTAQPGHQNHCWHHYQYHCWHCPTQIGWLLSQASSTIADTIPPGSDDCSARAPIPLLTPSHQDQMTAEPAHQYHCWHCPAQIGWLLSQATIAIADTFQTQIGWLLSQPTSIIADTSHWARPPVLLLTPSHPDQMGAEPGHHYHCWHCSTQTGWLLSQATSAIADTITPRSDGCSTRPLAPLLTLSHWARPPVPLLTPSHPDQMDAESSHQYHC